MSLTTPQCNISQPRGMALENQFEGGFGKTMQTAPYRAMNVCGFLNMREKHIGPQFPFLLSSGAVPVADSDAARTQSNPLCCPSGTPRMVPRPGASTHADRAAIEFLLESGVWFPL